MLSTYSAHNDALFEFQNILDPAVFWAMCFTLLTLGMVGLTPLHPHKDLSSHGMIMLGLRRICLILIGVEILLFMGLAASIYLTFGDDVLHNLVVNYAWKWGVRLPIFLIIGIVCRLIYHRWLMPRVSALLRKMRITQDEDSVSDMKNEIGRYKAKDFDPLSYIRPDKIFIGLNGDTGKPEYADMTMWDETNKMVVGATRYGKGVTYQIWAAQAIRRGRTVFYIDPKEDKWMPKVLEQEAKKLGKTFLYVDIADPEAPGNYAPFAHGTPEDRRSRFYEIMGLVERGTDADHYKVTARRYLFNIFADAGQSGSLPALLATIQRIHDTDTGNKEENQARRKSLGTVLARLMEWASYSTLNGKGGFSVEKTLLNPNGAVIYFRGSLDDQIILAATQTFLIEVRQEIKRLEKKRATHVEVLVDELRYLVSDTVLSALATIVGERATFALAFQNFGDLENPKDKSMNGKAVLQSVRVNCQVKAFFGGSDADTAEWIAKTTGDTNKRAVRMEKTDVNAMGGETWSAQRTFGDVQEFIIPENVVKALPPKVAVIMQPNKLANVVCVSPVKV